jgi:hypothetical protein
MNTLRRILNSNAFYIGVLLVTVGFLTALFSMPNEQGDAFLHSRLFRLILTGSGALFVAWLYMLPKGAIKRFLKGPGLIALIFVLLTVLGMYLFMTGGQ